MIPLAIDPRYRFFSAANRRVSASKSSSSYAGGVGADLAAVGVEDRGLAADVLAVFSSSVGGRLGMDGPAFGDFAISTAPAGRSAGIAGSSCRGSPIASYQK